MRHRGPFNIRVLPVICLWLCAIHFTFAGARPAQAAAPIIVDIDVLPRATPTGMLSLERIDLAFDNGLARTSITVNGKLKARASIRYAGNGALVGRWLVDGRPLQTFNLTLTFGNSITIETADLPPLPAIEPGEHEVTLQFSTPAVTFTVPVIRYTVESSPGVPLLRLIQPSDGAVLTCPRRDSLMVSLKDATSTLPFTWQAPVLLLPVRSGIIYQFDLFAPGDLLNPLMSARMSDQVYGLPAALTATLPKNSELLWQVKVVDALGGVVAKSEMRRVTLLPSSSIQLVRPADGIAVAMPQRLSWSSSRSFDHYEVRAYLNDSMLFAELGPQKRTGSIGITQAIYKAIAVRPGAVLFDPDPSLTESGLAFRWIVLGLDSQGRIQDLSEIGSFHLPANVDSLNGLPRQLEISGFTITVDSYENGSTPDHLTGDGTIRFTRDSGHTPVPLSFQDLPADVFIEQHSTVTGSGNQQQTVISEVMKGRVTYGAVNQSYPAPVALDFGGYGLRLKALRLAAEAGTAEADLDLLLPDYLARADVSPAGGIQRTGGVGVLQRDVPMGDPIVSRRDAVVVALDQTALEPGGDFLRELVATQLPVVVTRISVGAGVSMTHAGRLIVDFSLARDSVSASLEPLAADGAVYLTDGSAELAASSLFPVAQAASLRLAFNRLDVRPDGLAGAFSVNDSDLIEPVVPADYKLRFTSGSLRTQSGSIDINSITLGGSVTLPSSVSGSEGSAPTVHFDALRPDSGWLRSNGVSLTELEWGPGPVPFRILDATGELWLPYGTIPTDTQRAGIELKAARLDSPLRYVEGSGESVVVTSITQVGALGILGETAQTVSGQTTAPPPQPRFDSPELFDLYVRAAGVSGFFGTQRLHHTAKIGEFSSDLSYLMVQFTDNAVISSRLDGVLVVPKPADFRLNFTEATLTASGEIVGPKVAAPAEIMLGYWRSKLLLPTPPPPSVPEPAASRGSVHALQFAQLDAAGLLEVPTASDAPIRIAATARGGTAGDVVDETTSGGTSGGEVGSGLIDATGGLQSNGNTTSPGIGTKTGSGAAQVGGAVLTLSRSYLRISGAQLQFLIETRFGPAEFETFTLKTLDIGADGQIQGSQLRYLATHFLNMDFLADSAHALIFASYEGDTPASSTPLVTLTGNLTFPSLGARHITLAHTASGARADDITPNGGSYGNEDFLYFEAAELVFHNAYAEGKGSYKEFLGKSQVKVIRTLYLGGLMMVGADAQGLYERIGLGIGVDPVRAASLYASGAVTIGAKIGAAGVSGLTGGRSTAESEVSQLVGSVAELATETSPDKRVEKLVKSLADAVALARRIHKDLGGAEDDAAGTSLGVAGIALTAVTAFTGKNADRTDKRIVLAVADALDRALALIVKARPDGQPLPNDARNGIEIARLAVQAARAAIDDGNLSQSEWLALTDQLLTAAKGFSTDRGYQLVIELLQGTVEVARASDKLDDNTTLRVAARAFKTVRDSGLVTGGDAKDVLILAQALIEGMVTAKDMPKPNNAISLGMQVLDVAAGPETSFGGGTGGEGVKSYLRLARRSLALVGQIAGGIPYQKAGQTVQETMHDGYAGMPAVDSSDFWSLGLARSTAAYMAVDNLIANWVLIDTRPLATTVAELQNLIVCEGATGSCSGSDIAGLVANAVAAITQAQTPRDLLAGLGRLKSIQQTAKSNGKDADFDAAFDTVRRSAVTDKAHQMQTVLLQQMDDTEVRYEFSNLMNEYLQINRALVTDLELPGSEMTEFYAVVDSKSTQFINDLKAEINRATRWADAQYPMQVLLGIERQREHFGMSDDSNVNAFLAGKLTDFAPQVGQGVQSAQTSDQLEQALVVAIGFSRLVGLLGMSNAESSIADLMALAKSRSESLLQQELTNALQAGRSELEPQCSAALGRLRAAASIEDADAAVACLSIFDAAKSLEHQGQLLGSSGATAAMVGYTPEQEGAKFAELLGLLNFLAPALQADALGRMRSAGPRELYQLASRYFRLAKIANRGRAEFEAMVVGWIDQVPQVTCEESWKPLHDRLYSPAMRFVAAEKNTAINTVLRDFYARCAGAPTTVQGPDPNRLYEDGRVAEFKDFSKYLKELADRGRAGEPEALLKEELAWKIAERIKSLTAFFRKPENSTQQVLSRVYRQTDYVLRFRQASTPNRIIAAIQLMSEPLLEQPGIDPAIRDEVRRIADGLTEFAKMGGTQKSGVDLGIDLAGSLAAAHFQKGSIELGLITITRMGLMEARKSVSETKNSGTPIFLGLMAAAVIAPHVLESTLSGITLPPATVPAVELLKMLGELSDSAKKASPVERLSMAMDFLDKAAKMPAVDRYVRPLVNPVPSLLSPDTDQQDYITNLLLAELAAARNDNPVNVAKGFKSTCPSFSFEQGVQVSAPINANDLFVCAVDLAREAIVNQMKGAIDPLSPAGQAQLARQVISGMRREAVFSRASGDDTLSGISGMLEFRNGQFSNFDIIATFGLAGQLETASRVRYANLLLTIEQASYDGRDAGLLGSLGLGRPGMNRIFNTDYFNSPIKYLLVQIGSPSACLNMAADFGLGTPLGVVNTGRQSLGTCFNPFSFDLDLTTRTTYLVIGVENRIRLFYGAGTGGLQVGATAGIYPTVFGYGVFVDAGADIGLAAGLAGLEACGRIDLRAGTTAPVSGPGACGTIFVPDNPNSPNGPGVCRIAASIGADVRLGTDYRNFFLKAQAGIDVVVYVGGWLYVGNNIIDGALLQRFPTDRYGGWTGVTRLDCGTL